MKSCGRSLAGVSGLQVWAHLLYQLAHRRRYVPLNAGSLSISTFSLTTKRLLRCLRGGLPEMGIVSLGAGRRPRFASAPTRGGVRGPASPPSLSSFEGASGLTTTMGGAVPAALGLAYLRSVVLEAALRRAAAAEADEEPFVAGSW